MINKDQQNHNGHSETKQPTIESPDTNGHQSDLKQAIYYLPTTIDHELVCTALKEIYPDKGKELAVEWFHKSKNSLPADFDSYWQELRLTPYELHTLDDHLKKKLYDPARQAGWIPKAFRKGTNTKRPPSKKKLKLVGEELDAPKTLEAKMSIHKERFIPGEKKSYIPPGIINKAGACYFHPFMKKDEIPELQADYLGKLTKIVDCEVRVLEAIEYVTEHPGRQADDKEVRYRLELDDRRGKKVVTEVTHEELTTKTRFSSFLVSKGFIKFIGQNRHFDMFHAFLINEQEYPTLRNLNSWGEYSPGEFLFENGLYSVKEKRFIPADDQLRIRSGSKLLICPSGSEQVTPPSLSTVKADTLPCWPKSLPCGSSSTVR